MKKMTVATLAACVIAAVAIGLATPAMADSGGSVALPPGVPVAVYPQDQSTEGRTPIPRRVSTRTCPTAMSGLN